jgi:large subunit ribosomal protein L6
MSKLGKRPINIPEKVNIDIINENEIFIKGPLGEDRFILPSDFKVVKEENLIKILPKILNKKNKVLWGTLKSLLNNKIIGVNEGFSKTLILEGLGYSAEVNGREINFRLGFSHPVKVNIPENLSVEIKSFKNQYHIIIKGQDKQQVGQFASYLRKIKPRNIYKLKGFRYLEEKVKLKPVKKAVGK